MSGLSVSYLVLVPHSITTMSDKICSLHCIMHGCNADIISAATKATSQCTSGILALPSQVVRWVCLRFVSPAFCPVRLPSSPASGCTLEHSWLTLQKRISSLMLASSLVACLSLLPCSRHQVDIVTFTPKSNPQVRQGIW